MVPVKLILVARNVTLNFNAVWRWNDPPLRLRVSSNSCEIGTFWFQGKIEFVLGERLRHKIASQITRAMIVVDYERKIIV